MASQFNHAAPVSKGADIINKAQSVKLNPSILYEAVVDLSSEGLLTANCINMAAGILLQDLGLPTYFFENIKKDSRSRFWPPSPPASPLRTARWSWWDGWPTYISTWNRRTMSKGSASPLWRPGDNMEAVLESMISGHRREYYDSAGKRILHLHYPTRNGP